MPFLFLALLVIWLVLLGLVRGVLHARRGGGPPVRVGYPRGSLQWWVALLSAVGFTLMLAAPLTDIAGLGAIAVLSRPGVHIIGVVLVGAGIAVSVVGQAAMGESWRGDVDDDVHTPLVTGGPFRIVRNPIFTGTAITAVGLALIVPNGFAVAMVIVQLIALQLQVKLVEEPYLHREHGDDYRDYARRTGRFVPGVGRGLRHPWDPHRWS